MVAVARDSRAPEGSDILGTMLNARIERIGLAVHDLDAPCAFFERVFGARFGALEDVKDQGFRYLPFEIAGFTMELLCPYDAKSVVARFLERRGPGVHHVSFVVPDLDAALAELETLGVPVAHVHEYPQDVSFEGHRWREAFIHPQHAFGVLVHLAEKTPV